MKRNANSTNKRASAAHYGGGARGPTMDAIISQARLALPSRTKVRAFNRAAPTALAYGLTINACQKVIFRRHLALKRQKTTMEMCASSSTIAILLKTSSRKDTAQGRACVTSSTSCFLISKNIVSRQFVIHLMIE